MSFLQSMSLRCVLVFVALLAAGSSNVDRSLRIVNESGVKVELYWVHPTTGAMSLLSNPNIADGSQFPLNTFVGHQFQMRELPSARTGSCESPDKVCHMADFIISENDDQILRVQPGLNLMFTDTLTEARAEAVDLVGLCQENARRRMASSDGSTEDALKGIEELAACVEVGVARKLEAANEEISFQAKVRTDMAGLLENYTCVDDSLESTPDVATETWVSEKDNVERTVHVKHRRPSSQIHVIENFINEDECQAMADEAAKTLHRATVADGKGGSRLSENRKAMQAGISVPWSKEQDGDPIARISRRVYDYTNHVLGLGIEEFGQEDLMSIQYFGRGRNDTEPDRYTPHCDGDCTGLPHKTGTRMATMVMYCTLPTEGGSTNFRNAGVHVKPVAGNGIFFSYIDPESKLMDTGFTEHSGCPVFEGEKKIVTQWIRYGVDSENPWNSFNTLGIKISEAMDQ